MYIRGAGKWYRENENGVGPKIFFNQLIFKQIIK